MRPRLQRFVYPEPSEMADNAVGGEEGFTSEMARRSRSTRWDRWGLVGKHRNFDIQARSLFPQGWGLIDLLLRASNEGLLRPRVARARKIIRLHPFSLESGDSPEFPVSSP